MAIIDVITYNGEAELFDLRYNILKDFVDEFIVVEFDQTFSGKHKRYSFPEDADGKNWKVKYCPLIEEDWDKYKDLAELSSNTIGADHWKTEFMQKESIKDCLSHLQDDDIVFIGDCDEIWNPRCIKAVKEVGYPFRLRLAVYTYYLNNRSSEEFWGILAGEYRKIKDKCLNHLRSDSLKWPHSTWGWHFTSLKDGLRRKLEDSYTKETYANDWVMVNLDKNIAENKDFLGRPFTFKVDESDWPQYLKDNRGKYKHLCLNS